MSSEVIDILPPYSNSSDSISSRSVPNGSTVANINATPPKEFPFKTKRKGNSVTCCHDALDNDTELLWLFFYTHVWEKPGFFINVEGYREETETETDSDGNRTTKTVKITDFSIWINLGDLVGEWSHISSLPRPDSENSGTFNAVLAEYTNSKHLLKQIAMRKSLEGFNFDFIYKELNRIVYATGYSASVGVSFQLTNHKLTVYKSSVLMRSLKALWFWVLMVISCLWIFVLPWYKLLRLNIKDRLHALYPVSMDENQIMAEIADKVRRAAMNYESITIAVKNPFTAIPSKAIPEDQKMPLQI